MPQLIDLQGQMFGALRVVRCVNRGHAARWICRCSCGRKIRLDSYTLRAGIRTSCGCGIFRVSQHILHGQSRTRTYAAWRNMRLRCLQPTARDYAAYGGRGIKICIAWRENYINFLEDMGQCPEGLTLERKDVNGNYTKQNCCWASWSQQYANRRKLTPAKKQQLSKRFKQMWKQPGFKKKMSDVMRAAAIIRWQERKVKL